MLILLALNAQEKSIDRISRICVVFSLPLMGNHGVLFASDLTNNISLLEVMGSPISATPIDPGDDQLEQLPQTLSVSKKRFGTSRSFTTNQQDSIGVCGRDSNF